MRRKFFDFAAAVSLLLALLALTLSARSYREADRFTAEKERFVDNIFTFSSAALFFERGRFGYHFQNTTQRNPDARIMGEHLTRAPGYWEFRHTRGLAGEPYRLPRNTVWQRMGFIREADQYHFDLDDAGRATSPAKATRIRHDSSLTVRVPAWSVVIPLSVLPAWKAAGVLKRRRRLSSGRCPTCGYDLRAAPDRCPKCGAAVVAAK